MWDDDDRHIFLWSQATDFGALTPVKYRLQGSCLFTISNNQLACLETSPYGFIDFLTIDIRNI
ncbi:hypothetical protein BN1708_009212 [Verticillium longisporum]|uniref:Uncharacterized protein n=1 Tax=Verticillium longisporum TaxID=100787 RepID=A0A0G4KG48_VERLO|nr:hypothetical protein BN1708_009212 [Verticillium longisporum]